ncbi:MAG: peptidase T [Firmicutes bacterium]|nr:peptidase T [Bacillota bacterium]MDY3092240.1 peptidase T [Erysipelotrichaceae bacterium]
MDIIQRFLNYVSIDTQSDESSLTSPSTDKQFNLAHVLYDELKCLGISDLKLTDNCIVYARIPANTDEDYDRIGFIAHMDTSPDFKGKDVKPRIIKNYDGSAITLNEELQIVLDPHNFECLKRDIGSDLIVTDGTTLLGADDKAGIAIIMDMAQRIMSDNTVKHGDIAIAFTPDEEVGRGTENFDTEYFNVDYAYTVDGGNADEIEYENFNADSACVKVHGLSIHPGSAKGKMLNSQLVAFEFNSLLRTFDNPAYTEGYEGFNHLTSINGDCENTVMNYIIRNHDKNLLLKQENDFKNAMEFLNRKYGDGTVEVEIVHTYANMREFIEKRMDIIDKVKRIMREMNMEPKSSPIRGGTDGASLTYMGLPCPNLGTGGRNYHGKYEYLSINEFLIMSELVYKIVTNK